MRAHAALAALVAIACASCISIGEMLAPTYDMVIVEHRPDPIYEDFARQYVELCAVSQYRPKNGNLGGIPGHGVMYLKGACLDEDSEYPRLVPCGANVTDRNDPRHGTGVSVNKYFRNINWIGIPGKPLFFHGNLRRSTLLDQAHFDATVRAALPYYRNVELYPKPEAPERSLEEFIAQDSIGNDLERETLLEKDWLPMEPGVLIKSLSVHLRNDLYDTRYRLMVAQSPFFSAVTRKADAMLTDARFVELEPNLRYYRERYETILENRDDSLGWWSRRNEDYLAARERYYAYVEQRLADVARVLDALDARNDEY